MDSFLERFGTFLNDEEFLNYAHLDPDPRIRRLAEAFKSHMESALAAHMDAFIQKEVPCLVKEGISGRLEELADNLDELGIRLQTLARTTSYNELPEKIKDLLRDFTETNDLQED